MLQNEKRNVLGLTLKANIQKGAQNLWSSSSESVKAVISYMLLRYHFAFLDRICHVTSVDSRDEMSRYSPEARLHVVSCYNCDLALEFNDFMHFSVW